VWVGAPRRRTVLSLLRRGRRGGIVWGRRAQAATILFADLVGSTALASSQDPERTRATLRPIELPVADDGRRRFIVR